MFNHLGERAEGGRWADQVPMGRIAEPDGFVLAVLMKRFMLVAGSVAGLEFQASENSSPSATAVVCREGQGSLLMGEALGVQVMDGILHQR